MSENTVSIPPVFVELRKEVLLETDFDPWTSDPVTCIGLSGRHNNTVRKCGNARNPVTAKFVVDKREFFAGLTECPHDAKFYQDVEDFINATYCVRHNKEVKMKLHQWKERRTKLQESTEQTELRAETNHDSTRSQLSISRRDSDTQSQDSSFLFETALASPNDTQITTPDLSETLETLQKLQLRPTQEFFETSGHNDKNTKATSNEVLGNAVATDDDPFPLKESKGKLGAESQPILEEPTAQSTGQKTTEHCVPDRTLHGIELNLGLDDQKFGTVIVLKKHLGNEVVAMKVKFGDLNPPSVIGSGDANDSEIVYQSPESFLGASRVVELVEGTLRNVRKVISILDRGERSDDWFVVSQAQMIPVVQIFTSLVRSESAYADDEPSITGHPQRDLFIRMSPAEASQWLETLGVESQNTDKGRSGSSLKATGAPVNTAEISKTKQSFIGRSITSVSRRFSSSPKHDRASEIPTATKEPKLSSLDQAGYEPSSQNELPEPTFGGKIWKKRSSIKFLKGKEKTNPTTPTK